MQRKGTAGDRNRMGPIPLLMFIVSNSNMGSMACRSGTKEAMDRLAIALSHTCQIEEETAQLSRYERS